MKITRIILTAIIMFTYSNGMAQQEKKAATPFQEYNVMQSDDVNPFKFFTGAGLLLCAGDKESSNAMTIGWGGLGTLWGRNNMVTVFVAEKRYTKKFMDKARYVTIMAFDRDDVNVLR